MACSENWLVFTSSAITQPSSASATATASTSQGGEVSSTATWPLGGTSRNGHCGLGAVGGRGPGVVPPLEGGREAGRGGRRPSGRLRAPSAEHRDDAGDTAHRCEEPARDLAGGEHAAVDDQRAP